MAHDDTEKIVAEMREQLRWKTFRHFNGMLYVVTDIAIHSETNEVFVIYHALGGDFRTCAQPLEIFLSDVDKKKYPDVKQEKRFEMVEDEEKWQDLAWFRFEITDLNTMQIFRFTSTIRQKNPIPVLGQLQRFTLGYLFEWKHLTSVSEISAKINPNGDLVTMQIIGETEWFFVKIKAAKSGEEGASNE